MDKIISFVGVYIAGKPTMTLGNIKASQMELKIGSF
jgi:hypothetical protein